VDTAPEGDRFDKVRIIEIRELLFEVKGLLKPVKS
jgi:hypothetical protein